MSTQLHFSYNESTDSILVTNDQITSLMMQGEHHLHSKSTKVTFGYEQLTKNPWALIPHAKSQARSLRRSDGIRDVETVAAFFGFNQRNMENMLLLRCYIPNKLVEYCHFCLLPTDTSSPQHCVCSKLDPCPHCGLPTAIQMEDGDGQRDYKVSCFNLLCDDGVGGTPEEALANWNKHALNWEHR